MVPILWIAVAVGLMLCLNAMAESAGPRVNEPGQLPGDARLGKARDYDTTTVMPLNYSDRQTWEKRAGQVRQQIMVANGLWPMPEKTPLQAVIHGKIERDEYTIEKVYFQSMPGHYVTGNLYRPRKINGKAPGVLCPHGHWPNGRFVEQTAKEVEQALKSGGEQTREGALYPLQARCAMLARMGCVVFHYDMVGYADSSTIEHRMGFKDAEAELRLHSFMGLQTWNSIRALDFIESLPEVDKQRLAVTGASGGATQTMMLYAVDERLAAAFPAVMVSQNMQGGCVCENCSLLRVGTNNIEIAALFAPKPQAMTGANDWTKDIETAGLPDLKRIYGLYGAEERVDAKYASFPHNYNQVSRERMYNWFNRYLKLGWSEPVKEKPFVPVAPKELSVWDGQHPLPKDFVDAAALRKTMTQRDEAQLARLKQDPAEFRRVVGAALRVMVQDPSAPQQVEAKLAWKRMVDGVGMEGLTLSRPGSGEAVPAVLLTPAQWNGTTTVWAHPDGKGRLFDGAGKLSEEAGELLSGKSAILVADTFLTGEYQQPGQPASKPAVLENYAQYGGLYFGYNRSVLANRVHDLLTCVGFARQRGAQRVQLVGEGQAGVTALLAKAIAGELVQSADVDLHGFDFTQVQSSDDEMMLPGALKYGGIMSFAALCDSGETTIRQSPSNSLPIATPAVKLQSRAVK